MIHSQILYQIFMEPHKIYDRKANPLQWENLEQSMKGIKWNEGKKQAEDSVTRERGEWRDLEERKREREPPGLRSLFLPLSHFHLLPSLLACVFLLPPLSNFFFHFSPTPLLLCFTPPSPVSSLFCSYPLFPSAPPHSPSSSSSYSLPPLHPRDLQRNKNCRICSRKILHLARILCFSFHASAAAAASRSSSHKMNIICIYIHIYFYLQIYLYQFLHTYMYTCVSVCVCARECVFARVYACLQTGFHLSEKYPFKVLRYHQKVKF